MPMASAGLGSLKPGSPGERRQGLLAGGVLLHDREVCADRRARHCAIAAVRWIRCRAGDGALGIADLIEGGWRGGWCFRPVGTSSSVEHGVVGDRGGRPGTRCWRGYVRTGWGWLTSEPPSVHRRTEADRIETWGPVPPPLPLVPKPSPWGKRCVEMSVVETAGSRSAMIVSTTATPAALLPNRQPRPSSAVMRGCRPALSE